MDLYSESRHGSANSDELNRSTLRARLRAYLSESNTSLRPSTLSISAWRESVAKGVTAKERTIEKTIKDYSFHNLGRVLAVVALAGMQIACATELQQSADVQQVAERNSRGAPAITPLAEITAVDPTNTLFNHHATLDTPINVSNAKNMKLAWSVPTKNFVSHTPLVHGNRIYFADWGGTVYAVNKDGSIAWQKQVEQKVKKNWPWHGFAGTGAIGEGMLFEASVEGEAYALDLDTGEVIWKTRIADDPQAGNLSKMLYHNGLVYVGLSSVEELLDKKKPGFEPNFQGKVRALDARTGEIVWTTRLAEGPSTGVAVWSSFALDPAVDTLYFTTSNNYTQPANQFSDSLVAVNAKTGKILWHDQVTNNDVWTKENPIGPDYAFAAGPQIFDAVINGKPRKLVGAGQKSGVFYVWDRATGQRVWTVTLGYGNVGGGIHGEASIGPDRIILWSNNAYPYTNPEKHPMDIAAVNPATGNWLWVTPKAQPAVEISAGFLANDVYFVGSLDGQVRAYNAKDGRKLWTSGKHGSVASSIWVDGDMMLWGSGVPKMFGGNAGQPGLFAYTTGTQR
jgi:polyvinyl alcohol dehydrogenase (cytochrome)